ncbi:MAG: fibrobacter succinogenes major paralogous domain-containing protein [Bacteroidales bacterium]|nr:fibrobacter succinogenes major paralogous domain-containing protein [Bacteroidales bacterium]
MKKLFLFVIALCIGANLIMAQQPPHKMSYQLVVRNNNNELVVNQSVGIKISILEDNLNGVAVYMETHTTTTNANALATLELGTGSLMVGTNLADIDWAHHDYFIKAEIDPTGGVNYSIIGTQQLLTVPYAYFAGEAAFADSVEYHTIANRPMGSNSGDILYWNSVTSEWEILPLGQQGQVLTVNNGGLSWITNPALQNSIPPTVVTDTVFDITGRTVKVQCHIVNPGSTGVIASGVCWSLNPNPSLGNNSTTDGTSVDTFISHPTGLTSGTTYYVRAYATNSVGTTYGNTLKFVTPTDCGILTDYDGNTYNTIYIGAQCWMKENLKTTRYSNGVQISKGTKGTSFNNTSSKYYFVYNDDANNIPIYGLLYTWAAAMNGAGSSTNNPSGIQGICPTGWHLPSSAEWCELENYIEPGIDVSCSSTGYRGSMAKSMTYPDYWNIYTSNSFAPGYCKVDTTGFNTSGFSAVPGGYYYYYTGTPVYSYENINYYANWWTCTLSNSDYIVYRELYYASVGVAMQTRYTSSTSRYAYSVRCVKN